MDQLQATVMKAMLTRPGWEEYSDIVSPEILTDNLVQSLYGHIQSLHERVGGAISTDALRLDIEATYQQGETRADELLDVVSHIEEAPEVGNDALKAAVREYAKRQWLIQCARHIATHIRDREVDANIPADYVQRAVEVGEKINATVADIFEASLPGSPNDRPNVCPLGLASKLDSMLGGGIGSGELCVFLAPPKRGKTSYLCTIGARAAAKGKGVLHITLEISETRVIRRYENAWTQLTYDEMVAAPLAVSAARKRIKADGGRVYIQDWSHNRQITPFDIQTLARRLRSQGKQIDLVVVDYLKKMQPNRTKSMSRQEQRHLYDQLGGDMRAVANVLDVPVITAWQVNRAGNSIDTPTQEHCAESWGIIQEADAILSMGQSAEERRNQVMRIVVLEHRFSTERGSAHLHSDLDRCNIKPLEGSDEGPCNGTPSESIQA